MSFKETPFYTFSQPDITLVVGDQELPVHEYVISPQSDFFKAALRSETKEAYERRIKLPEIQPKVMVEVLNWLYRAPLTSPLDAGDTAFSDTSISRMKEILEAHEFLQIKGAMRDYCKFVEDNLQKLGTDPTVRRPREDGNGTFVTFHRNYTSNIVGILNDAYKSGCTISKGAMARLIATVAYGNEGPDSRLTRFTTAVERLPDPDGAYFRDISLALVALQMSK
ncbi:Kelch-like protein 10 [Arthrobotrys musiformis]|uniref:Kelch-like protein 10 n=1 Tax=Arthrobotrys musiformis TaxID=47236 RepID=A0AAV9WMY4_9PEZI